MKLTKAFSTVVITGLSFAVHAQSDAVNPKKYADNLLTVSPIQLTENGVAGFGISYERSLGKEGVVALYVPAIVSINTNNRNRLGTSTSYPDPMVYLMPGIKIYPTGNQGLAKYAVGPSLVVAAGQRTEQVYPLYGPYPPTYTAALHTGNRFVFGMVVNQSLNLNATPHLYVGTELGLGYSYVHQLDGVNQPVHGIVQFSFKIGYRF